MRSDPTLNQTPPQLWAAVVSGQTWKTYTLRPFGTLEAEYTRGPLIIWARKTGEGEALPGVGAPTPSPLETRALEVNTRAHFERAWRGLPKVKARRTWRTSKHYRWAVIRLEFISWYGFFELYTFSDARREVWGGVSTLNASPFECSNWSFASDQREIDRLAFNHYLTDCVYGQGHSKTIKFSQIVIALLLWVLKRDLSRRYIRRHPPVPAPRPLYARPRPPTAPLAPPVI